MEPECVVCLQDYDEGEHIPRVLSCGHSLCQTCTLDLPSYWGGNSGSKSPGHMGSGLVQCPECKQYTRLPHGGHLRLPKNIELMRWIQSGQKIASSGLPSKKINTQDAKPSATTRKDASLEAGQSDQSRKASTEDLTKLYLISREYQGEPVLRILPQKAIKKRKDAFMGFCIGDMVCSDQESSVKMQEVILQPLLKIDIDEADDGKGSNYEDFVRLAWERLNPEVRTELEHLLALAQYCKNVAKVTGSWMSEEATLFLVSSVEVEGIKLARSLFPSNCDSDVNPEQGKAEGESSDSPKQDVTTIRRPLGTLLRLGVELCEILLEVHAAGYMMVAIAPESLVLDTFSHLQLQINSSFVWREALHNTISGSNLRPSLSTKGVNTFHLPDAPDTNTLNISCAKVFGPNYEYVSPEVVNLFEKTRCKDEAEQNSSALSTSPPVCADKVKQVLVTPKADVWSLGCLLLQLFSGSPLLGRLKFSEVYSRVTLEKSTQHAWVPAGLPVLGQHVHFLKQVLKCFSQVPNERPQVGDIWWALKELLDDQALGSPSQWNEDFDLSSPSGGIQKSVDGNSNPSVSGSRSLSQMADEARGNNVEGFQITAVEVTTDAPSMRRALIDVGTCDSSMKTLLGHRDTVSCLAVCGDSFISASFDKTLRIWSLKDNKLLQVLEGHAHRITALAVHEASGLCVSGDYGGEICLWNLATRGDTALKATWHEHQDWRYTGVTSLIISEDQVLYSGSGDRTVKAWSVLDSRQITTMEGHKGVVSALLVEEQVLYSGSWDGTIRLWWRPDHSVLANLSVASSSPIGGIRTLVKNSASSLLFAGHDSGVIQVWNDEECVGSLEAHKGVVSALAFDQDWLYSGSWDGIIKAWPLEKILSSNLNPVEKQCSGRAVGVLFYRQDKLYVGLLQTIQIYSYEVDQS